MKFIIVTLALICAVYAQSDDDWVSYQKRFGKVYRNVDNVADRRAKWEKNFKLIQKHNAEYEQGLHSYTLGENDFADMSFEEFAQQRLTFKAFDLPTTEVHQIDTTRELRTSNDLRQQGVVTPIKDQGQCGACWAFTAAAAIEILYAQQNGGKQVTLSEQQLVDCNKGFLIFGNQGCNGGTFTPTFDYIKTNGLQTDTSYPYIAKDSTCKFDKAQPVVKCSGYVSITSEAQLVDALKANNPVALGIYASNNFMLYKSGIFRGSASDNTANPNHAVLAIGYDISSASDAHYIVKNSWSTNWGENGYVRLEHGTKSMNLLKMPCYPKA